MCKNVCVIVRVIKSSPLSATGGGVDHKVEYIRANTRPSNWGNGEGEPRSGCWSDEVIPHSITPGFFSNWPCTEADVSCSLAI